MADPPHPRPQPPQGLDAETRARRDAALGYVRRYGDPVLRERARPVEAFDARLREEVATMARVMDEALGVGLAATQMGILHRVVVYRVPDDPTSPLHVLVNPEVEWASEEREAFAEGCLSMPGLYVDVERPSAVRVRAHDEHGEARTFEARGPEASVVQHEIDHLDGVLILDRIPREARKAAMRELRERDR